MASSRSVRTRIGFGGLDVRRAARLQGLRAGSARAREAHGGPPPDRGLPVALLQLAGVGRLRRRHLRPAVAEAGADPMEAARAKLDAAFEFVAKLGVPFFTFHDRDVAPEGADVRRDPRDARRGRRGRSRATWSAPGRGCCGAPRTCSAIRATRPARRRTPIPRSSPTRPRRSSTMLETTHRLGGANYVLWGGREGYETLLNTDLAREEAPAGALPAPSSPSTSTASASSGTLLLEPKPQEPTKHQYDYDSATVDALPRPPRPRRTSTASTSRSTTPRWPGTASSTRSPSRSRAGSSAAST